MTSKPASTPSLSTLRRGRKPLPWRRSRSPHSKPGLGDHALPPRGVYEGNRVELLMDGTNAFPAMLAAISQAKQTLLLESYIFAADQTGRRFLDALVASARRGVQVRVLIDGIGSLGVDEHFFQPLLAAGGRLAIYHPPKPWRPQWGIWRRDHRKILTVDDTCGFIGGINISDDYAPQHWGGSAWHDAHAQIDGPAAAGLTRMVNRTWRRVTGEDWGKGLRVGERAGDVAVRILENRLTERYSIRTAYIEAIRRAAKAVRISNAYFIPDQRVRRELFRACRRGVCVQLLLAGSTDVPAVRYASRAFYRRMMDWGVEIYEWHRQVLHAKSVVVDGRWCSLGSYNMDRRSLLHNLEANVAWVDGRLGAEMDAQFEADIALSERIDPAAWHRRGAAQKVLEALFFNLRFLL